MRIEVRVDVQRNPGKPASVLVVEDHGELRRLMVRILEGSGYSVVKAESPTEALASLGSGECIDLLVTDLTMPDMNGSELARRARQINSNLKILFISGSVEVEGFAKQHPGATFLEKPFRPDELLESVQQILAA